ncbi:hypothetical protein MVEN_00123700 [Mycena venus]|uniref:Uncharacterized protein n=1 Tax=Mycena venus TaxID=2733690 RepID=A0A8H6Z8A1_9AGAR|nr:hypothetical protein MVEN_00123700 [Mycena venus]
MRNLIGQRPSLVPTGLGNSDSAFTAGVIIPGATAASDGGMEQEEEEDGTSSILLNDEDHAPGDSPGPTTGKRTFSEFDDEKSEFDDDGAGPGSGDDYFPKSPHPSESGGVVFGSDKGVDVQEEEEGGKKVKTTQTRP